MSDHKSEQNKGNADKNLAQKQATPAVEKDAKSGDKTAASPQPMKK